MLKVILNGCNGKMGQVVSKKIINFENMQIVAGIDINIDKYNNEFPVYDDIFKSKENADIIIDFSNPYCMPKLLEYGTKTNTPIVIATTGLSDKDIENIKKAADNIAIFQSANMSLGINVLISLVKKAASILYDISDIEIIEKHHNQKIDAPSGTAYMIANEINNELNNSKKYVFGRYGNNEKRETNDIGIHAIRGGTIAGEHSVLFAGSDEILEVKHTATSKKIFAVGAIKAAEFIVTKNNGLYNMSDLISE